MLATMSNHREISRRTLIGSAAAAAGAASVAGQSDQAQAKAKRTRRQHRADVIVVGAGLAGLTAARHVVSAGRSAIVLEARDRVGGRTLNHHLGKGKVIEVGGEWIGPTQDHIAKLAKEMGVHTFKTYNKGNYLFYENGKLTPYSASGPLGPIPPDPTAVGQLETVLIELDKMALTVPLEAPWKAAKADEWDSQTFETYKQSSSLGSGARNLLDLGIESVFACEPRDVSLLYVLFYIHSAGDEKTPGKFERLISTAGGAQDSRFVGGSQLVSIRAAHSLGKRVLLSQPVRRITQNGGGVTVHTDHLVVHGKQVIVTGPPTLTALIDYEPKLPAMRAQLLQRYPQGSVVKVEAIYKKPFWREKGLAGQVTSDTGPIKVTFDNSPPDGSPGVLLGFVEGRDARHYSTLSARQRKERSLACFVRYFGKEAAHPIHYVEKNWSEEEWTRGCYEGYTPPGVLTDYGPWIRQPFKRVHWAGSETSDYWVGYMDGAVRSGERAAREALADL
jgi:monoamine oxidase